MILSCQRERLSWMCFNACTNSLLLLPPRVDQGEIDYKDQREYHTQDALGSGKEGPYHHSHRRNTNAEPDPGERSLSSREAPISKRSQDSQFQEKGQCQVCVFEHCEKHPYAFLSSPVINRFISQWKLASRFTGMRKPEASSSKMKPWTMLRRPGIAWMASSSLRW